MPYLIGMDEAGYGPNLGPLIVAASVWDVQRQPRPHRPRDTTAVRLDRVDLYRQLSHAVSREVTDDRIAIADSKQLYSPGGGLACLERGVLSALTAIDQLPASVRDLFDRLAADPDRELDRLPWYRKFDCPLPLSHSVCELQSLAGNLSRGVPEPATRRLKGNGSAALGCRLVRIRARAVFPATFNDLTEQHGSKGGALSHVTLSLLCDVLREVQCAADNRPTARSSESHPVATDCLVVCDKHGGRNRYGPLVQQQFPEWLVESRCEGRAESRYLFGPPHARIDIRFRRQGERFLPTALASMTAKYVRELAMRGFNEYWAQQVPGIRATAGYPTDARRFKREIEPRQRELNIEDRLLWRSR